MAKTHVARKADIQTKETSKTPGGSLDMGIAQGPAGGPAFQVFMNFAALTHGLTFTPEQAQELGTSLIQYAGQAKAMIAANASTPQVVKSRSN